MITFIAAAKRVTAVLAILAGLAACSVTEEVDRVAVGQIAPGQSALRTDAIGRTLLVVDSGLRADTPDRAGRIDEAKRIVRQALADAGATVDEPASLLRPEPAEGWSALGEERLLQAARGAGLRSLLLVRVEDYTNLLRVHVPLPLPAPLWQTESQVGVRLKLVNVADGTVLVDVYRDRITGGFFTIRSRADLAPALSELMRSLVAARTA